jgi:4-diphosphocytidyl-2-C-methyl-D-erythritol kinase
MAILRANAKINIGLRILGRRQTDGYHLLETIFQEIDFADIIHIEVNQRGNFNLTCNQEGIPIDNTNLILKAINSLRPYLPDGLGAEISLEKNIPVGAGLGGGSSNAAAILKYFSSLCENVPDLFSLAVGLGADVPFFLKGGTVYATGIGDELRPVKIPLDWTVCLVMPPFHISTPWAYKELRISLTDTVKKTNISSFLRQGFSWRFFENDFERVIIPAYPQIGAIKTALLDCGALFAGLSGSGSTVYGIFCSDDKAVACGETLKSWGRVHICQPTGET